MNLRVNESQIRAVSPLLRLSENDLNYALNKLTPRSEQIVRMRLGWPPYCHPTPYKEIAQRWGLSMGRASQIFYHAMHRIRTMFIWYPVIVRR